MLFISYPSARQRVIGCMRCSRFPLLFRAVRVNSTCTECLNMLIVFSWQLCSGCILCCVKPFLGMNSKMCFEFLRQRAFHSLKSAFKNDLFSSSFV